MDDLNRVVSFNDSIEDLETIAVNDLRSYFRHISQLRCHRMSTYKLDCRIDRRQGVERTPRFSRYSRMALRSLVARGL